LLQAQAVTVPIDVLKQANVKLNERVHLLDIVSEQDTIIDSYKLYVAAQDSIINEFKQRLVISNNYNTNLRATVKTEMDKQRLYKHVAIGCVVVGFGGVLIGLLK
jgi:hypothetical protein